MIVLIITKLLFKTSWVQYDYKSSNSIGTREGSVLAGSCLAGGSCLALTALRALAARATIHTLNPTRSCGVVRQHYCGCRGV